MGLTSGQGADRLIWKVFVWFGVSAPINTFAIALANISTTSKTVLVASVAIFNTILFISARKFVKHESSTVSQFDGHENAVPSTGAKIKIDDLAVFDDAAKFFEASSDPNEIFRLVMMRIAGSFPFAAAALMRPVPSSDSMTIVERTDGFDPGSVNDGLRIEKCLAGLSYLSGEIEIDQDLEIESTVYSEESLNSIVSAAAIPIIQDQRVLAVLEFFLHHPIEDRPATVEQLEMIRSRVSPLFLSSFVSDRSISNAFTDVVTEIPNARALHLVLNNQLAESQRFRDERPLTVMALDLKDFRIVNQQFGHATGDRILSVAAARIRGQLRKMDFLARLDDDEFVIVLPLVDERSSEEISARIRAAFKESKIHIGELEFSVGLHCGTASFSQDGESAEQLIQTARSRKQQAKAADVGNVVDFPKGYVH